jgi:hypothetical protein
MGFKIGDRVTLKRYEDLPRVMKTPTVAKYVGRVGIVYDSLYRERLGKKIYYIIFEGEKMASPIAFEEDALIEAPEAVASLYTVKVEVLPDRVVASICKTVGDGEEEEIASGSGWRKTPDDRGVLQAANYAFYYAMVGFNRKGGEEE